MKNSVTEMVFILDRSGSMAGLEKDTIGGFNSMIEEQKKKDGKAFVTTILFDNEYETVHDRVSLESIKPMTDKEYTVRGMTALLDAVGKAINHIGNIHKYARKEDVPEHTIFVITTDGAENASTIYEQAEIKRMIERQKEKYGWEFIFIGANIDAVSTAKRMGINQDRAVEYKQNSKGTRGVYEGITTAVCSLRESGKVDDNWSENIRKHRESEE